ncbi:hypothetical protein ASG67_08365 [Sphingomonas sp. Leaf339]|uniref:hypothetical protein n=1 Tax=Sphingomonas sp. Leaf339 TaxID=1736343 RepID=UPI0006FEB2AE|nr:hypothetical protein [Sphingomonas sp. Leaf339]KQU52889.1 hypothetical protein ASG67_08365 [Sphingomonas sp. Leaf339]
MTTTIDWQMSAALENVPRGDSELPEVTSLRGAVREWTTLDGEMQAEAVLTPERPVAVDDGEPVTAFAGLAIRALAERLD